MKKIILIIFVGLFLSGCSVNYSIHFSTENVSESIEAIIEDDIYEIADSVTGDGYYFQKELVENNIPAIKDYSDYYQKQINVYGNNSYVNLKYNYNYDKFGDSYILNRCFENVNIVNDSEYLYVSLGGNFQCFDFEYDAIKINVFSDYKLVNHNAQQVNNNKYTWNINVNDETNIKFQVIKKEEALKSNIFGVLKIILFVILIITGMIIYLFKKNLKNWN